MKKLSLFLSLLLGLTVFLFQSCQKEENDYSYLSSEDANYVAYEYLRLAGDHYVLDISFAEAEKLGISKFDYDRMIQDVKDANQFVRQNQTKGGGSSLVLVDPQDPVVKLPIQQSKGIKPETIWLNTDLRGDIQTTDQNPGYASIFVPSGYTKLDYSTTSTAIMGWNTITVRSGQGTVAETTFFVGPFGGSGSLNLPVSNVQITVEFRTASSGGGTCAFELKQ